MGWYFRALLDLNRDRVSNPQQHPYNCSSAPPPQENKTAVALSLRKNICGFSAVASIVALTFVISFTIQNIAVYNYSKSNCFVKRA